MKYSIVFLISMLIYINAKVDYTSCSDEYEIVTSYGYSSYRPTTFNSTGIDKCKDRLNSTGVDKGYTKCCYIEYKKPGENELRKNCVRLTDYQYDHIGDLVKYQELNYDREEEKIDCKSFNLYLSLISLIFIILYF